MIANIRHLLDGFLGRGEAAITVPPMDGPFRPNHMLDTAEVVWEFADAADLAVSDEALWLADGPRLLRMDAAGTCQMRHQFPGPITALAAVPGRGLAVVVSGREVILFDGTPTSFGAREPSGRPLRCVTAVSAISDGSLAVSDASHSVDTGDWARDLLEHGNTGRVCLLYPDRKRDRELVSGLRFAGGLCEVGGQIWLSESWAHRVLGVPLGPNARPPAALAARLPGYPGRISKAANGGAWLTMFAARRRLVEFVLREDDFRKAMLSEVDPRFWIAPMLSAGNSFREPLQGGNVKSMGISKPWAPPRSYGLVVRLSEAGLPLYSLHSRTDGHHHGIVAAVEAHGFLYILSKGAGLLLRVPLCELEGMQQ